LGFVIGYLAVNKKRFSLIILFGIFVLLIFMSWMITGAELYNVVYVIRRFLTPMLVVLAFSSIYINTDKLCAFLKNISLVLLIFGFVDYFFLDFDFWDNIIRLPEFWKGGNNTWTARHESVKEVGAFNSYDFIVFTGKGKVMRRMVSSFTEPTGFASFLVSIHIFLSRYKRNILLKILIIVCAFLTLSKAAIIDICAILPLIKLFRKLFPKISYSSLFILLFTGFYFVAFLFVSAGLSVGPFSHINGFYSGVNILFEGKVFGNGIGRAGNFSDGDIINPDGGESGCGGMLAQVGIGALVFVGFFYALLRFLEKDEKQNRAAILMILAWTFIFVFSESSFGISGNFLFWAYPGIALYRTIHKSFNIEQYE
jgi:hypothetical protein